MARRDGNLEYVATEIAALPQGLIGSHLDFATAFASPWCFADAHPALGQRDFGGPLTFQENIASGICSEAWAPPRSARRESVPP